MGQRHWNLVFWVLSGLFFYTCTSSVRDSQGDSSSAETPDPLTLPPAKVLPFMETGDSSKVYYLDEQSILQYRLQNGQPDVKVSGYLFFHVQSKRLPIYLHTSLMDIKILQTPASFSIDAYDVDEGQALEVLEGTLRIAKAYDSPFHEPDTLRENELYMINKSIDLSEKEILDNDLLLKWWEKYRN